MKFLNREAVCQSLKQNALTPPGFLLCLWPPPPHSPISQSPELGKAFQCVVCETCQRARLQTKRTDVKNVRFLHGGLGGGEERGRNERTRLPKTRHGREAKLWRLEGGGLGSTAPAQAGPRNAPFLRFWPVNHCPFKHHAVRPGPRLPVLQLALAASRTSQSSPIPTDLPQQPNLQGPLLTSRLLARAASLPTFLSLPPSLLLNPSISAPRPNTPGTSPPPLPHPHLGGRSRRRSTHRPGSGLESPQPDPVGAEAAAATLVPWCRVPASPG